jgi:hypothetical protein
MVNESMNDQPAACELASFGEVLSAFSALRTASGRKRGVRTETGLPPWRNGASDTQPHYQPSEMHRLAPAAPARQAEARAPQVMPKPRRGRCQCGQCQTCRENQRWERIFQEKFATEDYYNHNLRIRYASPLSGF